MKLSLGDRVMIYGEVLPESVHSVIPNEIVEVIEFIEGNYRVKIKRENGKTQIVDTDFLYFIQ